MAVHYTGIGWNPFKRRYDAGVAAVAIGCFAAFAVGTAATNPFATTEAIIIRGAALTAFALLHLALAIGPLARLDDRFLPLLFNRRHLGVAVFFFAFIHAGLATMIYHGFGSQNPITSIFTAYSGDYGLGAGFGHFPFEAFGAVALAILFLMTATSHDFWLKNLGPSLWKRLHQLVYLAYGLVVAHVALGVLQDERTPLYPALVAAGFAALAVLHLAAWRKERAFDAARAGAARDGFHDACAAGEVADGCGKVVVVAGERIALFRDGARLFALSNVCRHQGGPLGEGRLLDGCATCPWHGWNYKLTDGVSTPPFKEVVPTYAVRVVDGRVWVNPAPLPEGTASAGAEAPPPAAAEAPGFFVGYLPTVPERFRPVAKGALAVSFLALAGGGALVAATQERFVEGRYEFGVAKAYEGVLGESPVPHFRGRALDGDGEERVFLLTTPIKQSPPPEVLPHYGRRVRLEGTLIANNRMAMLEIAPGAAVTELDGEAAESGPAPVLAGVTLVGEIVDTKCYLGVMRPGIGKVHRACAVRCIEGGIPPGLLVRDAAGNERVYLLAPKAGAAFILDPQWAGTPLRATGDVEEAAGLPVLRIERLERL
ncbi:MAG: Rieske 2Fe-2S domain-containing protein [Candidatus Sumerlaeia bacterium]|nr:Rieske 2Fe-2S domain-containing protein [Candidatus Sumerlaeia bacterium]